MAISCVNFKWYDGFFLSMLAISLTFVAIKWEKYRLCAYPMHIWTVVDYSTVFVFRLLMFVDSLLAAGMGLDISEQQRHARFYGRIIVLAILGLLLYPFLFAWSIIGTFWFIRARSCLLDNGQKMAFAIWLIFSYFALLGMICICIAKWIIRSSAHQLRTQQGNPISEFGVLIDLIRVPDWAFEAADEEMGFEDVVAYHLECHLTQAQREAVEARIQQLPKFELRTVPTNCSDCPICLEEFLVGDEVRGLPCAHNFHSECIDEWLRLNLNAKCPRCRRSVFPNPDDARAPTQSYYLRLLLGSDRSETGRVGQ